MQDPLESSKEIFEAAIAQYEPYAKVLMFSGGGDSMAALQACIALNIKLDYIMHVNTRTGIKETTEFVRRYAEELGIPYIEADAGSRYRDRVLSHGFLGVGTGASSGNKQKAHTFAFHLLKSMVYRNALSVHIRQRKRNRKILLINGARASESDNRFINIGDTPIREDLASSKSNVWVNIIHRWSKEDCRAIVRERKCPTNPVSDLLCRSGECMCGTVQGKKAREEAAYWFPEWGKWLTDLEAEVMKVFPWGWGEPIPKQWQAEQRGQTNLLRLLDDFQPMCTDCQRMEAVEEAESA